MSKRANSFWDRFRKTTVYRVKHGKVAKATSTDRYKGYRLYERAGAGGGWTVPELDRESVFDDKREAKRFVDSEVKAMARNPRRKRKTAKRNPGVGTMVPAQLKRMVDGTIKVFVSPGAVAKLRGVIVKGTRVNPVERLDKFKGISSAPHGMGTFKQLMERRRKPPSKRSPFGTRTNQRYLVSLNDSTWGRVYAAKLSTAKKKGEALARSRGSDRFFVQNQVTGSIINFKVT